MLDTPTDRRRTGRPIGHGIVAFLLALVVATLLNADVLLDRARELPYGSWQRNVGVSVMSPIASVSGFLQLTRPREALDSLLGHHQLGATGDPFATGGPPDTTPTTDGGGNTGNGDGGGNGKGDNGKPGDQKPDKPKPTRADPLKVLVIGDSLAGDFGDSLYQLGLDSHVVKPAGPVEYHIGTGLARPDAFNWPGTLRSALNRDHPGLVVLALGLNDDQPMEDVHGNYLRVDSPEWQTEYRRRVGAMMDIVLQSGAWVVYVSPPITKMDKRNQHYDLIRRLIADEARERPRAAFVDAYSLLWSDDHGYTDYLTDKDGQRIRVRLSDGVHLAPAGNDMLARAVWHAMGSLYELPRPSG